MIVHAITKGDWEISQVVLTHFLLKKNGFLTSKKVVPHPYPSGK